MSTMLLMKLFEVAPHRYDKGIRLLTWGELDDFYERLTAHIEEGYRVLDVGCGTGALTLRAARRGAKVKAIDVNPGMLDMARSKAEDFRLSQNIEFIEMGAAELGSETDRTYDAVMSGLCLSELTEEELDFTVKEVRRILKPGGLFLVADEVRPRSFLRILWQGFFRSLFKFFVFLLTGTTTKALKNFPHKLEEAGFEIVFHERNKRQNFLILAAKKGKG